MYTRRFPVEGDADSYGKKVRRENGGWLVNGASPERPPVQPCTSTASGHPVLRGINPSLDVIEPEQGFSSFPPQNKKGPVLVTGPFLFGGGGGNRTPVRRHSALGSTCLA